MLDKGLFEKLEKDFKKKVSQCVKESLKNKKKTKQEPSPPNCKPTKIIFDTDIASDIDDALALLMLLHLPESDYELLGVTTVYGFTGIRSAVASKIIEAHEKDIGKKLNIPVIAGSNCSIRDIPILPCWHANTEGIGLFTDDEIKELIAQNPYFAHRPTAEKNDCLKAADFIIEQVTKYPGQVTIVSLGAYTNIAKAFIKSPKLPELVNRIVVMGTGIVAYHEQLPKQLEYGKEYHCHSCHNVRGDASAAAIVFASGAPIFTVGHKVTHSMWFECNTVDDMRTLSFHKGKDPYSNDNIVESYDTKHLYATHVVGTLLDVWLKHRCRAFMRPINGTCPHDALTTFCAVYPETLLNYERGHLVINETNGHTCFIYDPINGNVFMGCSFKPGMVPRFMNLLSHSMMEKFDQNKLQQLTSADVSTLPSWCSKRC